MNEDLSFNKAHYPYQINGPNKISNKLIKDNKEKTMFYIEYMKLTPLLLQYKDKPLSLEKVTQYTLPPFLTLVICAIDESFQYMSSLDSRLNYYQNFHIPYI